MTQSAHPQIAQAQQAVQKAQELQELEGAEVAARYLGTLRRSLCESSPLSGTDKLGALLIIMQEQCRMFLAFSAPEHCIAASEWFLHIMHAHPGDSSWALFREDLCLLFLHYAQGLFALERIEDGRVAMRTALDTTRYLEAAIVKSMRLIKGLLSKHDELEAMPASQWVLMRMAEFLAQLDFAGMRESAFRRVLALKMQIAQSPQDEALREQYQVLRGEATGAARVLLLID